MYIHIYLNGYQPVLSVIFPLNIITIGMSQILGGLQGGVQLHIGADGGQRLLLSYLATMFRGGSDQQPNSRRGGPGLDTCILTIYIAIENSTDLYF